jgi:hypothetical protein
LIADDFSERRGRGTADALEAPMTLSRRKLLGAGAVAALAGGCRSLGAHDSSYSPTIPSRDERGHRYVETSEDWKTMCVELPSFAALAWPGYATKVVPTRIDGQPVVIQLWKGWCPQFLNLAFMPGGVGAEVGIYRVIPGRALPSQVHSALPPSVVGEIVAQAGKLRDDDLFWPYPELGATVSFEFINPVTGEVVFNAPAQKTYWRNRWMQAESYERYFDAQPGNWPFNKSAPVRGWSYDLRYTVNGQTDLWRGYE